MATQAKYQGWANYETWNVALWFGNDRGLYDAVREHPERFTANSAEKLVRKLLPKGTSDFKDRGKSKAYAKVDWQEIADDFNEMRGDGANEPSLHRRMQAADRGEGLVGHVGPVFDGTRERGARA